MALGAGAPAARAVERSAETSSWAGWSKGAPLPTSPTTCIVRTGAVTARGGRRRPALGRSVARNHSVHPYRPRRGTAAHFCPQGIGGQGGTTPASGNAEAAYLQDIELPACPWRRVGSGGGAQTARKKTSQTVFKQRKRKQRVVGHQPGLSGRGLTYYAEAGRERASQQASQSAPS